MKYKLKELIGKAANIKVNMQEQYDKIIDKLSMLGYKWFGGDNLKEWDLHKITKDKKVILTTYEDRLGWGSIEDQEALDE